jgi:DNA-binding FrmR family transcriptional regulator
MTSPGRGSILDDWHDIADDNLSVISFATSDTASVDTTFQPEASKAASSESATQRASVDSTATHTICAEASDAGDGQSLSSFDEVENYGLDTKDVRDESAGFASKADEPTEDVSDCDMDPTFLLKVVTSMLKLESEITAAIKFKSKEKPPEYEDILSECATIRGHLESLMPMLEGYSKCWDPEMGRVALPLDPALYDWLSGLRIELLVLQASVLRHMQLLPPSPMAPSSDQDLSKSHATLMDLSSQMESFLPIMQCDFEEFFAANLPLATANHDEKHLRGPKYGSNAALGDWRDATPSPPGKAMFHLRRALYALKDWVSDCIRELERCKEYDENLRFTDVLVKLLDKYRSLRAAMDTMLSNHASDWIEHSLAGGLTYQQFESLDLETIQDIHYQIKEVVENLRIEIDRLLGVKYLKDPQTTLEDRALKIKGADLDRLDTVFSILAAVFRLKRTQTVSKDASQEEEAAL